MKLRDYLNSEFLPRRETTPDMWSHDRYWGLPDNVGIYTDGFNCTSGDKQCKPLVQDINKMTREKYKELEPYLDCEVVRVTVLGYESNDNPYCVGVHIRIKV